MGDGACSVDSIMTPDALFIAFATAQLLYACSLATGVFLRTLQIDWVRRPEISESVEELPFIVMFYPVLRENEETMHTTLLSLERMDYPRDRYQVVTIPNNDDHETVTSLRRLAERFSFLRILPVPPTSDSSWQVVWDSWEQNSKAYWWHYGPRAGIKNLPPKKTRQLIYAFYQMADNMDEDFLVNYIDADSCPPVDHFREGAAGIKKFDVLQAQNIAGNCHQSWATTFHSFDHMSWDGDLYPHLSAGGQQPYWVLGKGLFFKASDLMELGGFHPWMTIEDPEVGLRFWANGKRLGIIESPLIEEVPRTFSHGITQRKRWVAGFFQALSGQPLKHIGLTPVQRFRARLNFVPCLSLWINAIGLPLGAWAIFDHFWGSRNVPLEWMILGMINMLLFLAILTRTYVRTWKRARLVMPAWQDRLFYLIKVNPVFLMGWWLFWLIPLAIGFRMYLRDEGLIWERTVKNDANHGLVRKRLAELPGARIIPFPKEPVSPASLKEISNG